MVGISDSLSRCDGDGDGHGGGGKSGEDAKEEEEPEEVRRYYIACMYTSETASGCCNFASISERLHHDSIKKVPSHYYAMCRSCNLVNRDDSSTLKLIRWRKYFNANLPGGSQESMSEEELRVSKNIVDMSYKALRRLPSNLFAKDIITKEKSSTAESLQVIENQWPARKQFIDLITMMQTRMDRFDKVLSAIQSVSSNSKREILRLSDAVKNWLKVRPGLGLDDDDEDDPQATGGYSDEDDDDADGEKVDDGVERAKELHLKASLRDLKNDSDFKTNFDSFTGFLKLAKELKKHVKAEKKENDKAIKFWNQQEEDEEETEEEDGGELSGIEDSDTSAYENDDDKNNDDDLQNNDNNHIEKDNSEEEDTGQKSQKKRRKHEK
jgi:hypothetical protein